MFFEFGRKQEGAGKAHLSVFFISTNTFYLLILPALHLVGYLWQQKMWRWVKNCMSSIYCERKRGKALRGLW